MNDTIAFLILSGKDGTELSELTRMGHNMRKCTFGQFFEYKKNKVTLNV